MNATTSARWLRSSCAAVAVAAACLLAGCGGGNDNRSGTTTTAAAASSTTGGASGSTALSSTTSTVGDPVARGKQLVGLDNCLSCHSTTGVKLAGPTWKGLAGSTVKLADGQTVTADHAYLVRSVLEPDAQIVAGYQSGIMSAVIRPGSIGPDDADAIARYIESLGG